MTKLKLKHNCTSGCKKDGRKLGLFCRNCNQYYHKVCVNLDTSSYDFLLESNQYICLPCKFLDSVSTSKPLLLSQDCNCCFKTHKSKVIIRCNNCNLTFHRACISNFRHTKATVLKNAWSCMSCIFPLSSLDDSDFFETFVFETDSYPEISLSTSINLPTLKKGLKLGHVNINGLYEKLDQLECLLHMHSFDVLFLSETHLNIDQPYPNLHIPGYHFLRQDRVRFWGGLACFYKDSLSITQTESFLFSNENEVLSIIVKPIHCKPILLSCIYRKPSSSHSTFLNELNLHLNKLSSLLGNSNECYVFGDLNIDLSKKWPVGDLLLSSFNEFGFKQLITEPTHHTSISNSLMGHIYANNSDFVRQSGVITSGLSNHDVTFLVRGKVCYKFSTKSVMTLVKFCTTLKLLLLIY